MFDLTVSVFLEDPSKDPITIVRATERRGDTQKGANLANSQMLPPSDVIFVVESAREPIRLRNPRIGGGVFWAPVDESKAKTVGDYGGQLIRKLLDGEPVVVIWISSSDVHRAIRLKTHTSEDITGTLEACLKGHLTLPLDPRTALP